MNNSGKQHSYSDGEGDDHQESSDDSSPVSDGTGEVSSAAGLGDSSTMRNANDIGLAARLTDMFVGNGNRDCDLLMQRSTQEGTVVQWLQALDMQVMGACRADERLKPLLKLNVSTVAEDRLLSQLSQHFDTSEVGLLARCLCIPLVSVRVGKINKQGTLLIPISTRGNLVLSLLSTSDLSISFLPDDGYAERLSIMRNTADCASVVIEGIPADSSGRSFAIRVPDGDPFYFWCSEKSRLVGNELLEKMKNLLQRKPSLADLTGISNSRLQRFVDHLRTYLVGPTSITAAPVGQNSQSPSLASKPSRVRSCSIQGILSPRPSSFKEGMPRNLASLRNVVRDKLRRRAAESSQKHPGEKNKLPESSPIPYYCWCPPVVSSLPHVITMSRVESFTLPPLSSSGLLTHKPSLNVSEIPPFLPEPLVRIPAQQITMLTPLMCDPIVHIPVMDMCSSGQAYLVSADPGTSVSIPTQETESEKNARDTLRLLIGGSSQFPSDVNAIANSFAAVGLVTPGEDTEDASSEGSSSGTE